MRSLGRLNQVLARTGQRRIRASELRSVAARDLKRLEQLVRLGQREAERMSAERAKELAQAVRHGGRERDQERER